MKASGRKERRATAFQRRSTFWLGLLRLARLSDFLWQKMWKLNLVIISLSDVWFSHYTHLPLNLFSHSNDSQQGSFLFQKMVPKPISFFRLITLCLTPMFYIMAAEKEKLKPGFSKLVSILSRANSVAPTIDSSAAWTWIQYRVFIAIALCVPSFP